MYIVLGLLLLCALLLIMVLVNRILRNNRRTVKQKRKNKLLSEMITAEIVDFIKQHPTGSAQSQAGIQELVNRLENIEGTDF